MTILEQRRRKRTKTRRRYDENSRYVGGDVFKGLENLFLLFIFVDASTLLGTNRKTDLDDTKSTDAKVPTKLTQDDFKTIYVSKIAPEEEKDAQGKDKNKMVDLNDDQYEVVDTSYVYIKLKQK